MSRRWEREALELAHGFDAFASSLAACNSAAPLVLTDPDRARVYLLDAHAVAERNGSVPLRGFVQFWINLADFCQPTIDLPIAADDDIEAFGGRGSVSWTTIRAAGAIRRAEQGHYDDALSLLTIGGAIRLRGRSPEDSLHRVAIEAVAGDPHVAFEQAASVYEEIRRFSDVLWRGELAVVVGITFLRLGRWVKAVEHIEAAKRAPMVFNFWYAIARRFGREARAHLDPADAPQVIDRARRTSVDQLLQRDFGALAQRLESVRPE